MSQSNLYFLSIVTVPYKTSMLKLTDRFSKVLRVNGAHHMQSDAVSLLNLRSKGLKSIFISAFKLRICKLGNAPLHRGNHIIVENKRRLPPVCCT